ncbi:ribonuclease 3 [Phanerochaete sordida]|uniref:Ribonuclease 3 n=1 Tax=Phanerochaete sordida TaxID=48140 RepID=A0A9P3L999_9APHY|nr:ribonuclease 3 [Phanerochaete sordida]
MVKAQVKEGLSMQSDSFSWNPSSPGSIKHSQPFSQSPTPTLKRHRSPSSTTMDSPAPVPIPPIPKLQGEIILEVFTHRSIRFPGAPVNQDSEYGDNDRLAVLGEKVLEAAVTDALFRKRPMLKGSDIEKRRKEILLPSNIHSWVTSYKLRDKVRCSADAVEQLSDPQEMALLFNCYVGAVHATQGMSVVQDWIGALVDPDYEPSSQVDMDMDPMHNAKKFKLEPIPQSLFNPVYNATPEPMTAPPSQPPPPAGPPPPLPGMPSMSSASIPNPLAPAQPHTAFLPLFNQTANQRRMFVEYPATFAGPAHAGKWNVKCVVNGIERGTGSGASKQLAKEEAARQAYYAMGWAPRS